MKNSSIVPSLANNYFNNLRNENVETIYFYNGEFMRRFVRQSIKGGRCGSFNQYYKSTISDEVFNIISKDFNVNGNVCGIVYKYFE